MDTPSLYQLLALLMRWRGIDRPCDRQCVDDVIFDVLDSYIQSDVFVAADASGEEE